MVNGEGNETITLLSDYQKQGRQSFCKGLGLLGQHV